MDIVHTRSTWTKRFVTRRRHLERDRALVCYILCPSPSRGSEIIAGRSPFPSIPACFSNSDDLPQSIQIYPDIIYI
ncbi:hypothetical protein VTH06DRAFT_1325 [Thermothelomyces fergusii]